ncbi:PadR family transcriptional regulator [Anaeroselena agilis]|uniref:PadR family transcriptional regulator n=1 Tax=Anaeroselena agilis TaxID=3063788 RepID=A0ABU3NXR1_9FIRM|nr:PadR family transcriptional regulator [Selenomonadales bacterium 4137-cl]
MFSRPDAKTWIKLVTALFILTILKSEAAHGNRIAGEIKRLTGDAVRPNPNFLYPLLRQLEEKGYVAGHWENPATRGKRVYTITPGGLAYLGSLKDLARAKMLELERRHKAIREYLLAD